MQACSFLKWSVGLNSILTQTKTWTSMDFFIILFAVKIRGWKEHVAKGIFGSFVMPQRVIFQGLQLNTYQQKVTGPNTTWTHARVYSLYHLLRLKIECNHLLLFVVSRASKVEVPVIQGLVASPHMTRQNLVIASMRDGWLLTNDFFLGWLRLWSLWHMSVHAHAHTHTAPWTSPIWSNTCPGHGLQWRAAQMTVSLSHWLQFTVCHK